MPLLANRDRQGKAEGKRGYGLLCTTSLLHDALRGKRSRGKSSTPSSSESRLDDISRFQTRRQSLPPILLAALDGSKKEVKRILRADSRALRVVDQDGFSALTWAARMGFVHLAAYLVEKGSEIDLCDVEGKSPLYWGCFSRQADVARMLVARGARPDLCSKTGWSPLLLCAYRGYTEILAILLAAAPGSVDKRHPQGLRPLRLAIHWNHMDTVQLLLSAGADPLKVGREGRNALEEAVLMGREECVRLLQGWDRRYELHRARRLLRLSFVFDKQDLLERASSPLATRLARREPLPNLEMRVEWEPEGRCGRRVLAQSLLSLDDGAFQQLLEYVGP